MLPRIWSRPLERMDALSLDDVEIAVRNDDGTLRELVMESGFSPSADADLVTTLMRAGDIPAIAALADGFTLQNRLDDPDRVHHMAASRSQNGCPRHTFTTPDLDLWVEDADGIVAAYGLFWFDPITGVELVEPMRTEEKYWRPEQPANTLRPAICRRSSERMAPEFGVHGIDGCAGGDELVDHGETLMIGGHDQGLDPCSQRRLGCEPPADVTGGSRLLDRSESTPSAGTKAPLRAGARKRHRSTQSAWFPISDDRVCGA